MSSQKYRICYDYRKRTSGGFFDAVFLSSIMITGLILMLLVISEVK